MNEPTLLVDPLYQAWRDTLAPQNSTEEMKKAFYSGAAALWILVQSISASDTPDTARHQMLDSLSGEIDKYFADLKTQDPDA